MISPMHAMPFEMLLRIKTHFYFFGVVSANDDLAYDPATSLDSILELTQDGKISNLT